MWGATDVPASNGTAVVNHFNPRSPCGERLKGIKIFARAFRFQSTLPVWGATQTCSDVPASNDFNPRSPCGERPFIRRFTAPRTVISIHAPRVGSDGKRDVYIFQDSKFQSTLPVWGATAMDCFDAALVYISIHAPRVGSDVPSCEPDLRDRDFNPRSPCGERRSKKPLIRSPSSISIHAPRVGSDLTAYSLSSGDRYISIHAPRVGSDTMISISIFFDSSISIHAPRVGSDHTTPQAYQEY